MDVKLKNSPMGEFLKALSFGLVLSGAVLTGCVDTPKETFYVNYDSYTTLSNGVYNLIHKLQTADEGLITIKTISNEVGVQKIENALVTKLQGNGYAVQYIPPVYKREKEQVTEIKPKGKLLTLNFQGLSGSNFFQLRMKFGEDQFYRICARKGNEYIFVSQWARLLGEQIVNKSEFL